MRILLVATVQSHICQFHKPLVRMLHEHGAEVHVAARDNLAEKNGLKLDFAEQVWDIPFERSPFDKRNLTAYKQLKQVIDNGDYDVVHTNTPVGGIVGRLAARAARKKGCQVFYTAHGFHFFKGGSRKNWILYYPIEKFMCRYTDELITITEEDYRLTQKKFHVSASRIHGIGANTDKYTVPTPEERLSLRQELEIAPEKKVILCTGELNPNKNQITAVRAMQAIVRQVPDALLLLAGNGTTHDELAAEIQRLGLQKHVYLLGYRTDLERYAKIVNLVLSCSHREGLPLNIVEGMLCKKPVVASINRGHRELIREGENGYLLPADDAAGFADRVVALLNNPEEAATCGEAGLAIAQTYTDHAVQQELEQIYRKRQVL